jgi:hypothetical protein
MLNFKNEITGFSDHFVWDKRTKCRELRTRLQRDLILIIHFNTDRQKIYRRREIGLLSDYWLNSHNYAIVKYNNIQISFYRATFFTDFHFVFMAGPLKADPIDICEGPKNPICRTPNKRKGRTRFDGPLPLMRVTEKLFASFFQKIKKNNLHRCLSFPHFNIECIAWMKVNLTSWGLILFVEKCPSFKNRDQKKNIW